MMTPVYRQNICLKWQVGADVRVPAMAAPGGLGSLRASTGNEVTMGTSSAAALADEDERVRSNGDERGEVAGVGALTEVPTQGEVRELAALDRGSFDDTALLFRRGAAGRSCRARAVQGGVTEDDRCRVESRRTTGSSCPRAFTNCWSIFSRRPAVSREKLSVRRAL